MTLSTIEDATSVASILTRSSTESGHSAPTPSPEKKKPKTKSADNQDQSAQYSSDSTPDNRNT